MRKKPESKAKKAKKKAKKARKKTSKSNPSCQECEAHTQGYANVQAHYEDLTTRFESMNGTVPFIKESIQRVEGVVTKMDGKIDDLHSYNIQQDRAINLNTVEIAKNSKITNWVEKTVILTGASVLVVAVIKFSLTYF